MSSPFSKYMEDKNPVSNLKSDAAKRSKISDKDHHAISSTNDAHSIMLDGSTYDKDYDDLTDAVGYVDPDVTITRSTPKQPAMGGLKALTNQDKKPRGSTVSDSDDSLINMGSPAHQGGYRGGGDVDSYYVPMAGVYQNLQDSISNNMKEVYKFQNYKGDAKKNLYTQEEVDELLKNK
tara:strand:- start:38 stop:571 length:534 start_codon:yes stop_codon:yes gene_type:complete